MADAPSVARKMRLCLAALLLITPISVDAAATLRQVQMFFRHGDRSAIHVIPNLPPVHWPQGLGQLSSIGMQQQYAAGFAYRQLYGGVVGWEYSSAAVEVRSTDVNRCLVSAESQLAGWFPQNTSLFPSNFPIAAPVWLPIPVHTLPTSQDSLLRPYDTGSCPVYTQWRAALPTSTMYAAKRAETAPTPACRGLNLSTGCTVEQIITQVGHLSGLPSLDIATLWQVVDTLFCRSQHNVTIFPWAAANNNYILDYLMELESWSMYSEYNSTLARRLTGGNMISEIIQNARGLFDPNTGRLNLTTTAGQQKLKLYSAHDTTVAALLAGLDPNRFGISAAPPYASAVIVELWSEETLGSAYFRLRYQNHTDTTSPGSVNINTLVLPGCRANCPVSQFAQLLSEVIPSNWTTECALSAPASQVGGTPTAVVLVAVLVVVAVAVAGGCYVFRKEATRQRRHQLIEHANDFDMLENIDPSDGEEV